MEEIGVKRDLCLHRGPTSTNYVKPLARYVFTRDENQAFMDFVSEVRAPIGYAATFKKHVGPNRLYNMKSHDNHVMLRHIFPTSVWNLLHPSLRRIIIHLGRTFQKLCTKVLNPSDICNSRSYVTNTLCMLEIWWPSMFFDLQTHLIMHLIDELEMCGPMGSIWCYPIE